MNRKIKFLTLLMIFARGFLTVSPEARGFLFENGDYSYKIVLSSDDSRSWFEAEEICREYEGGHLASISDQAENAFLNEKIQMISHTPREPEELWLGAIDEELFGRSYQWVDGQKFQYNAAFWAPGEPKNRYNGDYEVCVALKSTGDLADWVDDDCYKSKGYLCKIEGLPGRLVDQKRFGYEFDFGNYIYKFIFMQHETLTWPEAEIYCRDVEAGHLTSVRDLRESKNIEKKLRMLKYHLGFSKYWVGASDLHNEGQFEWTDGSPFKFQRWVPGEPSGRHRGMNEDCAVLNADPYWAHLSDEYCLHHLPFICRMRVCNQRADIGFAVDASTSVRINGFRRSKEFIKFVLQRFKISERGIHVGLIRYSSRSSIVFDFNSFHTHRGINDAIDRMNYTKGTTRTHRALRLARTRLFSPEGGSRPNIPKLLVVMTDGISNTPMMTKHEAAALKSEGVHVIVVGIGSRLNEKELTAIASGPKDIITAASFSRLKKIVVDVRETVCGGTEASTTQSPTQES